MSLRQKIRDEFNRSPIATLSAPIGIIVGLGGIAAAWLLARPSYIKGISIVEQSAHMTGSSKPMHDHSISLLIIGVFLALTPSFASATRILYRLNHFIAVPISVIIAALSIFLNRLNANILGYDAVSTAKSSALDNLIFYGTVLIFYAIAGQTPLIDFAKPRALPKDTEKTAGSETLSPLAFAINLIPMWSGLVSWSQKQMTDAFLS